MSDDLPVLGHRLRDMDDRVLRHPADRAASAALRSVPGLMAVARKLIELGYERALRQNLLASSVRLSAQQLPDVFDLHRSAYTILEIPRTPELYVAEHPVGNALTIGSQDPLVLVHSRLLDQLDADQLRVVFAHEAGHVLADHVLYGTVLEILMEMGGGALSRTLPTALPLMAVRNALLEWKRAAELTCDRIAALVVRDPILVCRTLMSVTAGTAGRKLDLGAFLAQADDYGQQSRGLTGRWRRLTLELNATHPLSVHRAHELMAWVRSGDYERIRDGDYPRRSEAEDPDVKAEAKAAADYYRERFEGAVRDVAGQAESATKNVADWLQKTLGGDGPR
ncbi:M48 family metallopeptidase [Patulibacter sp. SYSU D01012]|uniref:M48 family metallopeptidase n=1 Tax=Patulibacter sp. SYSU D01012 TaxID=2817381 RepID=UPI001B30E9EE|nr:M48 family metallopeptidase [Patulibacter sp. SYSU D01012]